MQTQEFSRLRILGEFIVDVVLFLALVLVGCAAAGYVSHATGLDSTVVYLASCYIFLSPAALYARRRGGVNFDKWDWIAFAVVPIGAGFLPFELFRNPFWIGACLGLLVYTAMIIRDLLPQPSGFLGGLHKNSR